MKKFKYKIIVGSEDLIPEQDEYALNDLGAIGWELVATDRVKSIKKDGVLGGKRQVYWFKKEISK